MKFHIAYTLENQHFAHKNGGLEDDFPFPLGYFKVPCSFSGVSVMMPTFFVSLIQRALSQIDIHHWLLRTDDRRLKKRIAQKH